LRAILLSESWTGRSPSDRPLPFPWRCLEAAFRIAYRIETLEGDPAVLLAYNRCVYHGPDLALRSGETVRDGDPLLELHFRREALLPLMQDGDPLRMGLGLARLGDRDLPRLARAVEQDPGLRDIRAFHAVSLFHRGVRRWGFEVMPVEGKLEERWFTWWQRLLMARDHAHGRTHVQAHAQKLVVRHIWLSREELLRRYPPERR
jgi:hypothetical protein